MIASSADRLRRSELIAGGFGNPLRVPMLVAARFLLELLVARPHVIEAALHVERLLRDVVALAVDDLLEAAHGVLDLDVLARRAGEGLGHEERLREELLDLAGARDRQLV